MANSANYYYQLDKEGKSFADWINDNKTQYNKVYGLEVGNKPTEKCMLLFLTKKYKLRMPHLQTKKILNEGTGQSRRDEFYKIIVSYPHNKESFDDVASYKNKILSQLQESGNDIATFNEEDFWEVAKDIDIIEQRKMLGLPLKTTPNTSTSASSASTIKIPDNIDPKTQNETVMKEKESILNSTTGSDTKIFGIDKKVLTYGAIGVAVIAVAWFAGKKMKWF